MRDGVGRGLCVCVKEGGRRVGRIDGQSVTESGTLAGKQLAGRWSLAWPLVE